MGSSEPKRITDDGLLKCSPAFVDGGQKVVYAVHNIPNRVSLVRLETIGPAAASEPLVLVWADVLGRAQVQSRVAARYVVLMAVAGVIAGLAVINQSSVLIVGAMAISPDLLPVTAACAGIVLGRRRLIERGLGTLIFGLLLLAGREREAA